MSDNRDHQYTIIDFIRISSEGGSNLFDSLARMCADMKLHGNASALNVYNAIINNPSEYPTLKDAAIHSMNNDGLVGRAVHTHG